MFIGCSIGSYLRRADYWAVCLSKTAVFWRVAKAQKSLFPLFLKGEIIMCRKVICLVSFVLALGLVSNANAVRYGDYKFRDEGADHLWTNPDNWWGKPEWPDGPPNSIEDGAGCDRDGTKLEITDGMNALCRGFMLGMYGNINEAEISGGTLTCVWIDVGRANQKGGQGYLKVTGGEIHTNNLMIPNQFVSCVDPNKIGVGHLDLFGGTLSTGNITIGNHKVAQPHAEGGIGSMDITEGTLIVEPDPETADFGAILTNIQGYIDNGWITAYGFKNGEIDPATGKVATVNMLDTGTGQIILTAELRNPNASSKPSPGDGLTVAPPVDGILTLSWMPADTAANHHVYFAADNFDVVNNRDPNALLATQAAGDEDIDTPALMLNTQYFWTVDEQDSAGIVTPGDVWSFTTPDYLVVDDMESYDNYDDVIYETWIDGFDPATGNGSGAVVGHDIWDLQSPYYQGDIMETSIVHSGTQSMPLYYNNDGSQNNAFYSEVTRTFDTPQDWTYQAVEDLSIWFRGWPGYVGSFTEDASGTYTMTAAGEDLWSTDGFHYAYKQLSGLGEVVARIDSVDAVHDWTRVGVMIRNTLEPDSTYFATTFAPNKSMVRGQYRDEIGGSTAQTGRANNVSAPIWVKVVRGAGNIFTSFYSTDGSSWEQLGDAKKDIVMGADVYVGLILSSHDFAKTAKAVFSNVSIAAGPWANQDIGITTNQQEPLYVALEDSAGNEAVVANDDPNAVLSSEFTEWTVSLQDFVGVDLTSVKKLTLRVGDKAATQAGGKGVVYFDDVRLYLPRPVAEPEAKE